MMDFHTIFFSFFSLASSLINSGYYYILLIIYQLAILIIRYTSIL